MDVEKKFAEFLAEAIKAVQDAPVKKMLEQADIMPDTKLISVLSLQQDLLEFLAAADECAGEVMDVSLLTDHSTFDDIYKIHYGGELAPAE